MADKLFPLGDGVNSVRMKDMGDGSVALVVAAGVSSASSSAGDKLVEVGDGITKKRYRDMGDGSVAEVIFGV